MLSKDLTLLGYVAVWKLLTIVDAWSQPEPRACVVEGDIPRLEEDVSNDSQVTGQAVRRAYAYDAADAVAEWARQAVSNELADSRV